MGTEMPERRSPDARGQYLFRPATVDDVAAVTGLVDAAYEHYVERIGGLPGPMRADYRQVISDGAVTVAVTHESVVGLIVLAVTSDGFLVENVAVHPSQQGRGLGRALLEFADGEARQAGFDSIYLFTHEKMTENLALYRKLGYVEYDRRSEGGFIRVFLRKQL
jgi:ribosomal protein S18 acetylase RimI-like enzyme